MLLHNYLKRRLLVLVSLLLMSIIITAARDTNDQQAVLQTIDDYVKTQMQADRIPGLVIGFTLDGYLWAKGYGYSDLENMVKTKPESAFRLASITKTLTAIAVLQQVEAGRLDLDAEVQKYVPYFPQKKWPVKVGQLLGHLGGISHYKNYDQEGHFKQQMDTQEAIAVFKDFDLIAEPGTTYHYSSYGYNLLGAVIEGATGTTYSDYLQENILKPLNMFATRLDNPDDLIPNRVRGYRLLKGKIKNSEFINISSRFAGGGTRSTVLDLLKFAQGICDGQLLQPATWHTMFTSQATKDGLATGYGQGWRVEPLRGHFMVSHGGSQAETRTYLAIFPTENFAVAVGSNLEGSNPARYARRLTEIIFGQDLTTQAYVRNILEQVLYNVCEQTFSYGLSRYNFSGAELLSDHRAVERAFSYFNLHTSKYTLKKNLSDTLIKLKRGIHPVSGRAFVLVGAHMTAELAKKYGPKHLEHYPKTGCLDFFSDYIALETEQKISRYLVALIKEWQKDWDSSYVAPQERTPISLGTDFTVLSRELKARFQDRDLYPDYSSELLTTADAFLENSDPVNTNRVLDIGLDLYPDAPILLRARAFARLYGGEYKKARSDFKRSFQLEPAPVNYFLTRAAFLQRLKLWEELEHMAAIAVVFYPEDASLMRGLGRLWEECENYSAALPYYKKALKLDPTWEDLKIKVIKWEKKRRTKK